VISEKFCLLLIIARLFRNAFAQLIILRIFKRPCLKLLILMIFENFFLKFFILQPLYIDFDWIVGLKIFKRFYFRFISVLHFYNFIHLLIKYLPHLLHFFCSLNSCWKMHLLNSEIIMTRVILLDPETIGHSYRNLFHFSSFINSIIFQIFHRSIVGWIFYLIDVSFFFILHDDVIRLMTLSD